MGDHIPEWKQRALSAVVAADRIKRETAERKAQEEIAHNRLRQERHYHYFLRRLKLPDHAPRPSIDDLKPFSGARFDGYWVEFDGYVWRIATHQAWSIDDSKNAYLLGVSVQKTTSPYFRSCGQDDEQLGRALQYIEAQREPLKNQSQGALT